MSRKVILLLALLALATLAVSGAHAGGAKGRGGGHGGAGAKRRGGGHAAAGGGKRHGLFTEPDPRRLSPDVVVSQRPHDGNVTTITEALKLSETAVRTRATGYFIIYVRAGEYKEYLNVTAAKVMLIGDGSSTVISGNRCKRQGLATEETATLTALGAGFMARDLAIYNTAGGPKDAQAVALSVSFDRSVFYRCDLRGYQDTLLANQKVQFYRECRIWGTIDFIFGDAEALFQDCYLYVRQPPAGKPGIITAHGRVFHDHTSGFIFQNCTVDSSHLPGEELAAGVLTYLGRPWRSHARVVFMLSSITSRIHADGWVAWNDTHQTGGDAPPPDHVNHTYFASYKNHDLGSSKPLLWNNFTEIKDESEAKKYSPRRFLHAGEWLRATGVPCYLGLGPAPAPLPRSQLE